MSATADSADRPPQAVIGLQLGLVVAAIGLDEVDRDVEQRQAANEFSQGSTSNVATMPVKRMRRTTATAAPSAMPQLRIRGGNCRQASAMTTALSPDNRTFTQMIWRSASQRTGWSKPHHVVAPLASL